MEARSSKTGSRKEYWDFIVVKERELKQSIRSERDWRQEQRVLAEMTVWMHGQDAASLARTSPEQVYLRIKEARREQERQEEERAEAVEAKLDEFFTWALRRWDEGSVRFRSVGREYLMTEHPLRQQTQDALTAAVLDWAFTHTQDPDFLSKSPSEVAVYLLAKNSVLLTAIELGQQAPPHLDYVPLPDETAATPEDLAIELLVGVVPLVGEAADLQSLMTGQSVTGRKLRKEEKLLAAVGVLLPFVSGRTLAGAELVERTAVLTGRGLEEVRVLQRVASHLSPKEAQEVDRMLRAAAKGERLVEGDVELLQVPTLYLRAGRGVEAAVRVHSAKQGRGHGLRRGGAEGGQVREEHGADDAAAGQHASGVHSGCGARQSGRAGMGPGLQVH
jgi:hypothetical protein